MTRADDGIGPMPEVAGPAAPLGAESTTKRTIGRHHHHALQDPALPTSAHPKTRTAQAVAPVSARRPISPPPPPFALGAAIVLARRPDLTPTEALHPWEELQDRADQWWHRHARMIIEALGPEDPEPDLDFPFDSDIGA
jgi:hypothetical protein